MFPAGNSRHKLVWPNRFACLNPHLKDQSLLGVTLGVSSSTFWCSPPPGSELTFASSATAPVRAPRCISVWSDTTHPLRAWKHIPRPFYFHCKRSSQSAARVGLHAAAAPIQSFRSQPFWALKVVCAVGPLTMPLEWLHNHVYDEVPSTPLGALQCETLACPAGLQPAPKRGWPTHHIGPLDPLKYPRVPPHRSPVLV